MKRDIGKEILEGVRELKEGRTGRTATLPPIARTRAALREIEGLMGVRAGTPEGDRLDVLATLVEAWERKHFPLDAPDAIETIGFCMEQRGLTARDLVPMISQLNRVYEVLGRKRPLTLPMIRRLHEGLGIPAESLTWGTDAKGKRAA